MKKALKWMLLAIMVVSLTFVVSCNHESGPEPEHVHTWGTPVVTKAPTCTEKGSQTLTCTVCGETETESIPATGHSYSTDWDADYSYHWHDSTCEHTGLKGSFEPHTWDSSQIIKESSCEEEGLIRYTCKCGATKEEAIPKHTFAKTWTSDADYHWHAATCAHTDQVSEKAEHTWNSGASQSDGSVIYTCTVCKAKKTVAPAGNAVRLVTAGPGEDSSNQAVISWHASAKGSYLEYTDADGEEFVNVVANAGCNEELSTADWKETSESHYRCKVFLEGLTPGSTYKYRVRYAGGGSSATAEFKTSDADTTYFQFLWMSDLHTPQGGETYINRVAELIDYAEAKNGVDLDFVLFSGDMVQTGKYYEHWMNWSDSGLLNNYTYAFVCGNHEYYNGTRDADGNKVRETNAYYKDVCAYPANNNEGTAMVLDSNYWFIWNRVLFVCVDNFTSEGTKTSSQPGSSLSDQQAWFKAVVEANEGNYDYLIFCQHLPWFNKDTSYCEYGNYSSWYKIFDQYKVDFALSSDEHHYRRTYALFKNRNPNYTSTTNPDAEKAEMIDGKVSKGTVYVTSNQTEGSSLSNLRNEVSSGLKYIEYSAGGQGGVYFTVTPTEMTLHQIGAAGREYDTITVLKKDRSK